MQPRSPHLGQPLSLLLIVITVFVLWHMRQLILIIFAAILLAQGLNLQSRAFQKLGMRPALTRPVSIAVLLALAIGFVLLIVPLIFGQSQELLSVLPQGLEELENWLAQVSQQIPIEGLQDQLNISQVLESLQPLLVEILARPIMFVSVPLAASLNLLIILVLALMLWGNPTAYRQLFIRLFPSFYRVRAGEMLDRSGQVLSTWLDRLILEMVIVTIVCGFGLWVLGVPFALAQAVLAGFLTFIPYLGPILSVIPPLLLTLERPPTLIAVVLLYAVLHGGGLHYGLSRSGVARVRLLPGIALLSQILLAQLFGVSGLVLAFPVTLVLWVWINGILVEDILNPWGDRDGTAPPPASLEPLIIEALTPPPPGDRPAPDVTPEMTELPTSE